MSALLRYLQSGHRHVGGWLTSTALTILPRLIEAQARFGIRGPVCEIGVHHGRLFILLHLSTQAGEQAVGWDLFEERQEENVDHSGLGSRATLMANLAAHGASMDRVRVITANSLELTPEAVISACEGRPRVFSVDGGHTAEITQSDMRLAGETICDGGLVVLDDCFNESWPGVLEGTARYFLEGKPRLVPAIIGGNKLICTTDATWAAKYQSVLNLSRGLYDLRRNDMFGQEVLSISAYKVTLKKRVLHHPAYLALRGLLPKRS